MLIFLSLAIKISYMFSYTNFIVSLLGSSLRTSMKCVRIRRIPVEGAQMFLSFRQLFNVSYQTASDFTSMFFSAIYPEHFQCVFLLELETKCHVAKYETVAGVFQSF